MLMWIRYVQNQRNAILVRSFLIMDFPFDINLVIRLTSPGVLRGKDFRMGF